ncbi:glycosyltransferase [Cellulomonas biazotea]|uniref:GDP-mannose:glycolipid 4-beta-D-mannosyltransferase n=1 Tax=Cellulomonas biazotea TaxID=1709 RepID=A0A402DPR6_9CELL|nr:glycosyltransferase [Cellulomonas biazotea]GCE76123.1 GDP-mannose:glycolipid 4-beta-D-mannosyltransferase [Cellulomonas biazotea]
MTLTVLESFPAPRRTTNPYLAQLLVELPADVRAVTFDWRTALVGRYDVFHVHWPEKLLRGTSRAKTAARFVTTAALLARLALTRTPVVRTLHNVDPHESGSRLERTMLRRIDRRTSVFVRLNGTTPLPADARPGTPLVTIAHPHYRDWFATYPRGEARPGRILFFGLVRPYKGVEELIEAFRDLPGADLELRVVGSPETDELRRTVEQLAAADPRVDLRLAYVDDDVLAAEIGAASLVVLPYRRLHNSGAALLGLSLDRPVLVPAGATSAELAAEVGDAWVTTFTGTVTADDLLSALARTSALDLGQDRPDLAARDWPGIAEAHAAVFREAYGRRGRRARAERGSHDEPALVAQRTP